MEKPDFLKTTLLGVSATFHITALIVPSTSLNYYTKTEIKVQALFKKSFLHFLIKKLAFAS